jgi:hypothetical protein
MKKIFILLVMLISVVSISAQRVMKADTYIYKYVGLAGDTVNVSNDSVWNHTVQINKREGVFYNASVKVADVTANAACKVILRGKIFDTDAWTVIETKAWKGGGTDTIINFTQNTNKQYYRYLDFKLSGTATKAKLSVINLSLKR